MVMKKPPVRTGGFFVPENGVMARANGGQRKTPPKRGFPGLASQLLLAVSEETQQEQEEVDEVEIETQRAHDGVAAGHLA